MQAQCNGLSRKLPAKPLEEGRGLCAVFPDTCALVGLRGCASGGIPIRGRAELNEVYIVSSPRAQGHQAVLNAEARDRLVDRGRLADAGWSPSSTRQRPWVLSETLISSYRTGSTNVYVG